MFLIILLTKLLNNSRSKKKVRFWAHWIMQVKSQADAKFDKLKKEFSCVCNMNNSNISSSKRIMQNVIYLLL